MAAAPAEGTPPVEPTPPPPPPSHRGKTVAEMSPAEYAWTLRFIGQHFWFVVVSLSFPAFFFEVLRFLLPIPVPPGQNVDLETKIRFAAQFLGYAVFGFVCLRAIFIAWGILADLEVNRAIARHAKESINE